MCSGLLSIYHQLRAPSRIVCDLLPIFGTIRFAVNDVEVCGGLVAFADVILRKCDDKLTAIVIDDISLDYVDRGAKYAPLST